MNRLDYALVKQKILVFIKDYIYKSGFNNGLIGVSGGIDSALVLTLTAEALGKDNVFALLMPYKLSSDDSLIDGKTICDKLDVKYEVIDISPSVDAYFENYPTENPLQIGNKCARERMSVLYDFSVRRNALVVGTSNKSEILIGYATQYGDSAAALLPIGELYKTQIFEFSKLLDIPEAILNKKPSADLWAEQTDEGEIGLTYDDLDEILYNMVEFKRDDKEIEGMGFSIDKINRVRNLMANSEFKRIMPPIAPIK